MSRPLRKYDDTTLILAGGVAAILLGAAATSSWAWLRDDPFVTPKEHRKQASKITLAAFGVAGAIGAAVGTALLNPFASRDRGLMGVADKRFHQLADGLTDSIGDLRRQIQKLT